MSSLALIAIGGNSLLRAGQRGTIAEQRENAAQTTQSLTQLIQYGYNIVLTHGNGPQVGAQLLRSELAAEQVSPEPLDVCGADTQGAIGYMLEQALETALSEAQINISVATVITQTVVAEHDSAFQHPTKPVGPFYSEAEAQRHVREEGWTVVEDSARGYRRVVASPEPLEIIEIDAIRSLTREGYIVIAGGGGGIPVVRRNGKLSGVAAVIDKDLASALMATLLNVDLFIISTDADFVYLNYNKPGQKAIKRAFASEMQTYYDDGHFPPGSMGPKILAALRYLQHGGREVFITTPHHILDAVRGQAGTHILPDPS